MKSLVSQLYILNDPFNQYPTIKIAHSEPDPTIKSLNNQGVNLNEFIYFNGIRGPIKIWDVSEIPEEINIVEKFSHSFDGWGSLDNLEFRNN